MAPNSGRHERENRRRRNRWLGAAGALQLAEVQRVVRAVARSTVPVAPTVVSAGVWVHVHGVVRRPGRSHHRGCDGPRQWMVDAFKVALTDDGGGVNTVAERHSAGEAPARFRGDAAGGGDAAYASTRWMEMPTFTALSIGLSVMPEPKAMTPLGRKLSSWSLPWNGAVRLARNASAVTVAAEHCRDGRWSRLPAGVAGAAA